MRQIIAKAQIRRKVENHPGSINHIQSEYAAMCEKTQKNELIPFTMEVSETVELQYVIDTDCIKTDDEVIEYFKQGLQNSGIDVVSISKVEA